MATKRPLSSVSSEEKKRQERLERFSKGGKQQHGTTKDGARTSKNREKDWNNEPEFMASSFLDGTPFVGTNQQLEKSYLRLTTFPRREDVRPLPILIKALEHVKRKYQQNEDFEWCNDQLKSIRQDITVQSIRDHPLVLDVYQTHARVLLEQGDLSEFNQCLTNLLQLYRSMPHPPPKEDRYWSKVLQAEGEFRAYSVLYSLIHKTPLDRIVNLRRRLMQQEEDARLSSSSQSNPNTSQHRKKRRRRSGYEPSDDQVSRTTPQSTTRWFSSMSEEETDAWNVVRAVEEGRFTHFFRLYSNAPHMSPYLMDFLVQRVRTQAYRVLVAAHRPTLSLEYLQQQLQFDSEPELRDFLRQQNVVYASIDNAVDCRQSQLSQSPLK
jgi:SAC3 family protein LENG8/THP3